MKSCVFVAGVHTVVQAVLAVWSRPYATHWRENLATLSSARGGDSDRYASSARPVLTCDCTEPVRKSRRAIGVGQTGGVVCCRSVQQTTHWDTVRRQNEAARMDVLFTWMSAD